MSEKDLKLLQYLAISRISWRLVFARLSPFRTERGSSTVTNPLVDHPAEAGNLLEYNCDLIGSLPLELLLQVVEYLGSADIVRSRRVRNCLVNPQMFKS